MSTYRSYYDYRKNYDTRSSIPSSTTTSSTNTVNKSTPKGSTKVEDDKTQPSTGISKYTTSYRRFPQTTSVSSSVDTSSDSKISKEMRLKYGPDGYKPKTEPPLAYNSKKGISTPFALSNIPKTHSVLPAKTSSNYSPYSSYTTKDNLLTVTPSSSRRSSREDISRIGSVTTTLKPGITRYRTTSTSSIRNSREDLTPSSTLRPTNNLSTSSTSRYSRYTMPTKTYSNSPSNYSSRQNSQELTSPAQKSSTADDDTSAASINDDSFVSESIDELVTLTVVTRGTSPTPPTSTTTPHWDRTKRSDIARQIQRDITRLKTKPELMCDKEMQSDRADDTARYSRFGSQRTSSSWNPYLDIKYTPSYSKYSRSTNTSSSDKISQFKTPDSSLKKEKSDTSLKSNKSNKIKIERQSPTKLPPKSPSTSNKSLSHQSLDAINKDFRKSVLNMSQNKLRSKTSSSDSETSSSSKSKNINKLVPKATSRSRSTSIDSTSSSSPINKSKTNIKSVEESVTEETSRTSQGISEINLDESKPDQNTSSSWSDKPKFKIRPINSGEVAWWLKKSDDTNSSERKPPTPQQQSRYSIRPIESGERAWWLSDDNNSGDVEKKLNSGSDRVDGDKKLSSIRLIESGERAWWMKSDSDSDTKSSNKKEQRSNEIDFWSQINATNSHSEANMRALRNQTFGTGHVQSSEENDDSSSDELENYVINLQGLKEPLGDRLSPDGIESTREDESFTHATPQFISKHTNIDDLLNTVPTRDSTCRFDSSGNSNSNASSKLDDSALQLYKDGDYGAYLDLEASISEQQEEFEGFQENRKNSIILRTQLSVRVHSIIEKLLNSDSRELRRSLFSLKQIFQEDKDLVHEFVQNDGLSCLIKVGTQVDQNYQNYILRALGQLMLYVDGMNGVIEHNLTIQWLYTLIASKFRLVVKTALKLLLVFVEYVETNCMLLIKAIHLVDHSNSTPPWSVIMRLLKDHDSVDIELLIYAMTLINKCLNGIPDQDTYYDQVDSLEEQGMESIVQKYLSRQGTDLDLLRQLQIYEAVLEHEDGDQKTAPLVDETIRKTLRNRKSISSALQASSSPNERRKSRRHSTGTSNAPVQVPTPPSSQFKANTYKGAQTTGSLVGSIVGIFQEQPRNEHQDNGDESSSSSHSSHLGIGGRDKYKGVYEDNKDCANQAGVTPALRRRRERAERQRSFIREQETATLYGFREDNKSALDLQRNNSNDSVKQIQSTRGSLKSQLSGDNNNENEIQDTTTSPNNNGIIKKPWAFSMMYSKSQENDINQTNGNILNENGNVENQFLQLNKENSVKDLTQKLSSQNIMHSPSPIHDDTRIRISDMSGLIFKAKEGLAKSKSKIDVLRSPTSEAPQAKFIVPEVKKTESELHWEELARTIDRPLNLCDLDFTDLASGDEVDILAPSMSAGAVGPPPPPPPGTGGTIPPPGPPPNGAFCTPPPAFSSSYRSRNMVETNTNRTTNLNSTNLNKKNKKTVKLFWKEIREDPISIIKLQSIGNSGMIWDELKPVIIDTQKLEHLFESRAKDSLTKKQQELNKNKEIIVLDHKRSNAINIGMTKLPPPRTIKTAILKMDATIMNREGIEKLLTMLPTEEERTRIQDAQAASPDLPLGSAEQFLLTLASISELPARLKLWAFKLDFECSEREIAEPLMDLKQGIELLKSNKTFRGILSTLLSIGTFLNGSEVKGFQIDYLAKVPEVKDTVHKHSLLHHLCHMVMEKFPESTDLYSEIGAITRVSKVDFDELRHNIQRLEIDCKASWDHLKLIAKHDGTTMKVKMSDFLADCAERIILLSIIHRRVINRYKKFLLWIGVPLHQVPDTKPNDFCRIISEFALEYRTTRERVLQQLEKKANHRERNKTRGKMITEMGKFSTKEERADAELRHVLGTSDISDIEGGGTLPWRRRREHPTSGSVSVGGNNRISAKIALNGAGDLTDADDEILESLVKTATKVPTTRTMPRERKRTRNVDRKSIKRSRTRESMYGVAKDSS